MKQKNKNKIIDILKLIFVGTISGLVNGFFGAGGGLIIVPMLKKLKLKNSKVVHATTLGCVLFMCLSGAVIYIVNGIVNYKLVLFCLVGSLMGSFIAVKLLKNLKNVYIDLIFSCVLIIAGISLLFF